MKIDSRSLWLRLLVPVLLSIVVISTGLVVLVYRISGSILEDYHRHDLSAHAAGVRRLLDTALAELTTARLLENPTVVEAMKRSVIEAASLEWKNRGVDGILAGNDGTVIASSLEPEETTRIVGDHHTGYFLHEGRGAALHGREDYFPAWGWRVITLSKGEPRAGRSDVAVLLPLVALGGLFMTAAVFVLLRRNLQRPVAAMVAALKRGGEVGATRVAEFDLIGETVNTVMGRLRERTAELEDELAERRRAEAAVLEREDRIRLLLHSAAEGIYGVDKDGICTFCNPSCCRMLGYGSERDLLGRNIHLIVHHSHADGTPYPEDRCRVNEAVRTGMGVHVDSEVFWRPDGSAFPVEYWAHPIFEQGRVSGAVVAFFDVSERRASETLLRESEKKYRALIETTGTGFVIVDDSGCVVDANREYVRLAGYERLDEIVGRPVIEWTAPHDRTRNAAEMKKCFERGFVRNLEIDYRDRHGKVHPVEINATKVDTGKGPQILALCHDIADRRQTDLQLRHAQKMEGIGQLAGGMAHDFNNVLNAILGYTGLIEMKINEDDPVMGYLNQISLAVQRGTALTQQILAFSRKQAVTARIVDLNQAVAAVESMLRRLIREDIRMQVRLHDRPLPVLADISQIEQVLINLVTNARDAMPEGGSLSLMTEQASLDETFFEGRGHGGPGEFAVLSVTDTGIGMDEGIRQRIFDPFFTTKGVGRGTGLGLAMVYGILGKHNGHITVASEPGHGTVFRLYLPLESGAGDIGPQVQADMRIEVRGGTEPILMAEDDPAVRRMTRTILEGHGYEVIQAVDGEDAVRKFMSQAGRLRLAVLDGIMPGKNGKDAFLEMRGVRPDLKVIFLSGYAEDIFRTEDLADMNAVFLSKPVAAPVLLKHVREALDS